MGNEFMDHVQDERVVAYFATLDLQASDAITLFELLDSQTHDERGIAIDDFVHGCLRLKGPAKSADMAAMMAECKVIYRQINRLSKLSELQYRLLNGGKQPPPLSST